MKRFTLYILIVLTATLLLFGTGCTAPTALSMDEFLQKAAELGYSSDPGEKESRVYNGTSPESSSHIIYFTVFESESKARSAFKTAKDALPSTSTMSTSVSLPSHEYEKLTGGNTYYVIYRVSSTLLKVETNKSNTKAVDAFLKNLGY